MSRVPIFISYRSRRDLLDNVLMLIPKSPRFEVIVINNSGTRLHAECTVVNPPVPLHFTQSHNWMLKMANERDAPFYLFMHTDISFYQWVIPKLCDMAEEELLGSRKWSVIFTNYDTICAYNTEAFNAVGGYDTQFEAYFSDNDVYRRVRLAGYPTIESGLDVTHFGSQTIKSDPFVKYLNDITFPLFRNYYVAKWGGQPGEEKFDKPFNGVFQET